MTVVNTVVVGGGHTGLAMSYCLTQRGVEHLVLERGNVGQRWRDERWDTLTLLTPNWATQLPGFPYDGDEPDGFESRDGYVDGPVLVVGSGNSGLQIVEDLLSQHRIVFASLGRVRSLPRRYRGRDAVRWLEDLGALDTLTKQATPDVRRVPPPLLSGVGGGHDLNLRRMSDQGAVFVGRLLGHRDGRLQFGDDVVQTLRASAEGYRGFCERVDRFIKAQGLTVPVDATPCSDTDLIPEILDPVTELDLVAAGIRSVVWATGFRVAYNWIDVDVFDLSGEPVHQGGISPPPGLCFLGLRCLTKYKSFFIYGVGEDAERLAAHIASRQGGI